MDNGFLEILNDLFERNAVFAAYKEPNEKLRITSSLKIPEVHSSFQPKAGFHMMPFSIQDFASYYIIKPDVEIDEGEDFRALKRIPSNPLSRLSLPKSMPKSEYFHRLELGIEKLKNRELDKFVFSRVHSFERTKSVGEIFRSLIDSVPKAMIFFVNHPRFGAWMGATPEVLLKSHGGLSTIHALAGTRKYGNGSDWGIKEVEEQLFVKDFIKEKITSARIKFTESPTHTHRAGPVEHLRTEFRLNESMNESQLQDLITSLHPTPAVCGTPTNKALNLIQELEPVSRSYYAGFLGNFQSLNDFGFYVNLRSMQVGANSLALRLGGGITSDSNPEAEWNETNIKAETLLHSIR